VLRTFFRLVEKVKTDGSGKEKAGKKQQQKRAETAPDCPRFLLFSPVLTVS